MEKKVILAVDDTPENIMVIQGILGGKYQVKAATSGQIALRVVEKLPHPDLILLDVMMPEMDGYEVCRLLKSDKNTRNIPILFVTAKITAEDKRKSLDMGGLGHITKPIDPEVLCETVELALLS